MGKQEAIGGEVTIRLECNGQGIQNQSGYEIESYEFIY